MAFVRVELATGAKVSVSEKFAKSKGLNRVPGVPPHKKALPPDYSGVKSKSPAAATVKEK